MNLSGRCLCGSVQYTSVGEPQFVFLCHCRDCQLSGGSLAHFGVMVPEAGFTRTGEVRSYTKSSDAGREITREFCPVCGTGINNRLQIAPGMVVIKGGTLDDPAAVPPTFELFARSKHLSWTLGSSLKSFDGDVTGEISKLMWKAPS